jgi:hypothetical protein
LGSWDKQPTNPKAWHFNFRGPDVERLVAGRERILLDRFYNELSANPASIDEPTRRHYARLYAKPGAIHNAFGGQFAAFATDASDNQALFAKTGKLPMPILAIGGDHSYGTSLAAELETVAGKVRSAVNTNSGHWIMEEQPDQALALLVPFVVSTPTQGAQKRLTSSEIDALPARVAGAGTSGHPGVSTRVLYGDPAAHGLYSIELSVPPNTVIEGPTVTGMTGPPRSLPGSGSSGTAPRITRPSSTRCRPEASIPSPGASRISPEPARRVRSSSSRATGPRTPTTSNRARSSRQPAATSDHVRPTWVNGGRSPATCCRFPDWTGQARALGFSFGGAPGAPRCP